MAICFWLLPGLGTFCPPTADGGAKAGFKELESFPLLFLWFYSFSISSTDKPVHSATISIEIFLSIILFAVSSLACCAPCDSPIEMPSSRASLSTFFMIFCRG